MDETNEMFWNSAGNMHPFPVQNGCIRLNALVGLLVVTMDEIVEEREREGI